MFAGKFKSFFDNKPNQIPTVGIRVQPDLQAIFFEQRNTLQCSIPATSLWLFSHPCVNFDLHRFYKDDTTPDIYRSMFYEICATYDNFDHIYTDGSKMGDRVASTAICSNMVRSTRLPNNASIFRAELYAITLAMYFIRRSRNSNLHLVLLLTIVWHWIAFMCWCAVKNLHTHTLHGSTVTRTPQKTFQDAANCTFYLLPVSGSWSASFKIEHCTSSRNHSSALFCHGM